MKRREVTNIEQEAKRKRLELGKAPVAEVVPTRILKRKAGYDTQPLAKRPAREALKGVGIGDVDVEMEALSGAANEGTKEKTD